MLYSSLPSKPSADIYKAEREVFAPYLFGETILGPLLVLSYFIVYLYPHYLLIRSYQVYGFVLHAIYIVV